MKNQVEDRTYIIAGKIFIVFFLQIIRRKAKNDHFNTDYQPVIEIKKK